MNGQLSGPWKDSEGWGWVEGRLDSGVLASELPDLRCTPQHCLVTATSLSQLAMK